MTIVILRDYCIKLDVLIFFKIRQFKDEVFFTEIGFVPKTVFLALVGATSGEVFVDTIPMRPKSK